MMYRASWGWKFRKLGDKEIDRELIYLSTHPKCPCHFGRMLISLLREFFFVQAVLMAKNPTSNNSNRVICFGHGSQSPSWSGVVCNLWCQIEESIEIMISWGAANKWSNASPALRWSKFRILIMRHTGGWLHRYFGPHVVTGRAFD